MRMRYRIFRSAFKSWESLLEESAAFASKLPTDRVASISHSEDQNEGVVIVWYWATEEENVAWGG